MLVLERRTGEIVHRTFHDILAYLHPGDLLVGNNSRVIPARLHGVKVTGRVVEIFLLRPAADPLPDPLPARARESTPSPQGGEGWGESRAAWECLVGGKELRPGVRVRITSHGASREIAATILAETASGGRVVAFDPPVSEWLWAVGEVPRPPYIHRPLGDPERYQTVYSRIEGSVASSTAGLHFTPELMLALRERGVNLAFVTLHIGLDTFRPVQVEEIEQHQIHPEIHPAEAGQRVRREGADRPGVFRGDPRAIPVLQFWGCNADLVKGGKE